jgi:predicted nuclease of predicted toxin-antitoxin system
VKKIKLDENFPYPAVEIFSKHGIDAPSVHHQNMDGSMDDHIYDVCIKEGRILITLDLDFANIIRYPSAPTPGIVLVRSGMKINLKKIAFICERLAHIVVSNDTQGKLFIAEDTRIRIRRPDERIY